MNIINCTQKYWRLLNFGTKIVVPNKINVIFDDLIDLINFKPRPHDRAFHQFCLNTFQTKYNLLDYGHRFNRVYKPLPFIDVVFGYVF